MIRKIKNIRIYHIMLIILFVSFVFFLVVMKQRRDDFREKLNLYSEMRDEYDRMIIFSINELKAVETNPDKVKRQYMRAKENYRFWAKRKAENEDDVDTHEKYMAARHACDRAQGEAEILKISSDIPELRSTRDYYERLVIKYKRACSYPFLYVPPDAPPPEK